MSGIPIHIQRRFEQRWAARFVPSALPASGRTDAKAAVAAKDAGARPAVALSPARPTPRPLRARAG